ncbi:MAG: hypothetical protein JW918_06440 [Anaerolineae bacterium]|nr:hypothetical protein [Anaerolineae bacterium]
MIWTVLIAAAGIALSVLLIKVFAGWAERQFVRIINSKLNNAEILVNDGKLPEDWVLSFRQQIEDIRLKGGSESKMERVGHRARQHCLRNLDDTIKFFKERNVTDSEDTRQFLLTSLKERWDWVAAAKWQDLLAPEMSAQQAAEAPAEE